MSDALRWENTTFLAEVERHRANLVIPPTQLDARIDGP